MLLIAPATSFGREKGGTKKPPKTPVATTSEPARKKSKHKAVEYETVVVAPRKQSSTHTKEVIYSEESARVQRSAGVEGLFKDLAGVQLSRKSFAGSDNNKLRIRGLEESRLLILLNGASQHGAGVYGGYYVDWSSLSLEEVDRVEVFRGAGPAKYGNTLGGVVNIVTRLGSDKLRTIVRSAGGNLGTWNLEASHGGGIGLLRYNLAASHYETDGCLRNAFAIRNAIAARVGLKLPAALTLTAGVRYTAGKGGMIVYNRPDSPYYDDRKSESLDSQLGGPYVGFRDHGVGLWGPKDWGDGSYWLNERWQFDWGLSRKADNFGFSLQVHLFDEKRREHFYAMDAPNHLTLRRDSKPEDWNWDWRADFNNSFKGAGHHKIEYGAEGHYLGYGNMYVSNVDTTYFSEWGMPTASSGMRNISSRHGAYLQDTWRFKGWLEVGIGLRFDSFHADGPEANAPTLDENTWSPRLAISVRPWKGGRITGRYARAYRFPTLPEYYWWYSGFQPADRKDLTSEKAHQGELEIGQKLRSWLEAKLRGYYYQVGDYVRTIFGYKPSRVVYNIDRVDLVGFELEVSCKLPRGFSVWGNYTFQKTKKHGDALDNSSNLSDELAELPEHRFSLGLDYRHSSGLKARLVSRYVGLRHAVRGNLSVPGAASLAKMNAYVDMDVNVSYPVLKGKRGKEGRVFLNLENLLNQRYEEEYGYAMPGITVMGGLDLRF